MHSSRPSSRPSSPPAPTSSRAPQAPHPLAPRLRPLPLEGEVVAAVQHAQDVKLERRQGLLICREIGAAQVQWLGPVGTPAALERADAVGPVVEVGGVGLVEECCAVGRVARPRGYESGEVVCEVGGAAVVKAMYAPDRGRSCRGGAGVRCRAPHPHSSDRSRRSQAVSNRALQRGHANFRYGPEDQEAHPEPGCAKNL